MDKDVLRMLRVLSFLIMLLSFPLGTLCALIVLGNGGLSAVASSVVSPEPRRNLSTFRHQPYYRSDMLLVLWPAYLCIGGAISALMTLFAGVLTLSSEMFLYAAVSLLVSALFGLLSMLLYRGGAFRLHPGRNYIKKLAQGEDVQSGIVLVLLHNQTNDYVSSFSRLPNYQLGKRLCVLDWERDLGLCDFVTNRGRDLLRSHAHMVAYVEPVEDKQAAEQKLCEILTNVFSLEEDRLTTQLCVAFVMPEPDAPEIPPDFGYSPYVRVIAVRNIEEISFQNLLEGRFPMTKPKKSDTAAVAHVLSLQKEHKPDQLRRGCQMLYEKNTLQLLDALAEDSTEPRTWDDLLRRFYRTALLQDPGVTSLMALMDHMDLLLRLALYTIYARRGMLTISRETIPDDFRQEAELLLIHTKPEDAIYESLHTRRIPCKIPNVLQELQEVLRAEFKGEEYSFFGMCAFLYYVRNKTRGHGSVQEDNCYLLWVLAVEISLALGQFLCLDRFRLQICEDKVMAGWDKDLTDLTPFLIPQNGQFSIAFDASKKQKVSFIDYFGGEIIVPEIRQVDMGDLQTE